MAPRKASAGIDIDVSDLQKLQRTLRRVEPEIAKHLTVRLRAVGADVASTAQTLIRPYSRSIPGAISVRVATAKVSVVAKGTLAGLLEIGNAQGRAAGSFRHPVFGNKSVWVRQSMHPFLAPAVAARESDIVRGIDEAVEATFAELKDG